MANLYQEGPMGGDRNASLDDRKNLTLCNLLVKVVKEGGHAPPPAGIPGRSMRATGIPRSGFANLHQVAV
jgi:hypothetical protein